LYRDESGNERKTDSQTEKLQIARMTCLFTNGWHSWLLINPNREVVRAKVFSIGSVLPGIQAALSQKASNWYPNVDGLQRQVHR
jgi:hypothetical protein